MREHEHPTRRTLWKRWTVLALTPAFLVGNALAPLPSFAQKPAPVHSAGLYQGTCDAITPEALLSPFPLTAPTGEPRGSESTSTLETGNSAIGADFDTVTSQPSLVLVVSETSPEKPEQEPIACGAVGGVPIDGVLKIALLPLNKADVSGLAEFSGDAATAKVDVTLFSQIDAAAKKDKDKVKTDDGGKKAKQGGGGGGGQRVKTGGGGAGGGGGGGARAGGGGGGGVAAGAIRQATGQSPTGSDGAGEESLAEKAARRAARDAAKANGTPVAAESDVHHVDDLSQGVGSPTPDTTTDPAAETTTGEVIPPFVVPELPTDELQVLDPGAVDANGNPIDPAAGDVPIAGLDENGQPIVPEDSGAQVDANGNPIAPPVEGDLPADIVDQEGVQTPPEQGADPAAEDLPQEVPADAVDQTGEQTAPDPNAVDLQQEVPVDPGADQVIEQPAQEFPQEVPVEPAFDPNAPPIVDPNAEPVVDPNAAP